jgi:3-hydroxyisobutyrate dehydrogenase-like beta-hydroxyacid dehydrogenase
MPCFRKRPPTEFGAALIAVPTGDDSRDVLTQLHSGQVRDVVDLTTQPPASASANSRRWQTAGGRYFAGGSMGGQRAIRLGIAGVLVGPKPPAPLKALLACFGNVEVFPTADVAARFKLLHNAFLILENEAARAVAEVALGSSLSVRKLARVISLGGAGRPFARLSAIRHLLGGYPTSYRGAQAAKDWLAFWSLLEPEHRALFDFVDVDEMVRRLYARGEGPWI